MRQSSSRRIGNSGETAVKLFFEDLGWGVIQTEPEDLGTDMLVFIRESDGSDTGLVLGVQVKTGNSFLRERTSQTDEDGFWFREENHRHKTYWTTSRIPHILVLQSEDHTTTRLWQYLKSETILSTGLGIKVLIPDAQPLSNDFKSTWKDYVETRDARIQFEGSAWDFDITTMPETKWSRYALLVPRLVAPNPNRQLERPLAWQEAVAFCVKTQSERWETTAKSTTGTPSVDQAKTHSEWGWRFAAGVQEWIGTGSSPLLESLDSSEQYPEWKVAHAVCLSLLHSNNRQFEKAIEVLALVSCDGTLTNTDKAWIEVHRGRLLTETGHELDGKTCFATALALLSSDNEDVTSSAIRASIRQSLYMLGDWTNFDPSDTIQT
jgi:hypothetical protein